jgi:hypothetical protein
VAVSVSPNLEAENVVDPPSSRGSCKLYTPHACTDRPSPRFRSHLTRAEAQPVAPCA